MGGLGGAQRRRGGRRRGLELSELGEGSLGGRGGRFGCVLGGGRRIRSLYRRACLRKVVRCWDRGGK